MLLIIVFGLIIIGCIALILLEVLKKFDIRDILLLGLEISIVGCSIISLASSNNNFSFYIRLSGTFMLSVGFVVFIIALVNNYKKK